MADRSGYRVALSWVVASAACGLFGATPASAQLEAEGLSNRFRQASRQALPAVVTVRPLGVASPFDGRPTLVDQPIRALHDGGSGVVVDAARGLVVTNDHVVAGANQGFVVILANGRERPTNQVWRDPKSDLALLQIDPTDLVAAAWGDSTRLDIGDWVLAIGGPFGLSGTVTAGIVSGKGRGIGMALYEDLIQTDAAINPGNSGGPLINLQGEVVGINTALKSNGGGYEGVGFAIPSSRVQRVVADLAEFGRVQRAYLGISIRPLDPVTAARLNLNEGAVVASVVVGSPAAGAGLRPGDVVLTVSGQPVGSAGALQGAIEVARVGEPLDLTVDRGGRILPIQFRPEPQPELFGLPAATTALPPTEVVAPIRPRGLRINVPGANLRLPGPNLDITPFGVSRPPGGVAIPSPVGGPLVPTPGPVLVPAPEVAPAPVAEPKLHPLDSSPPPGPGQPAPIEAMSRSVNFASLGMSLAPASPALAERYHLDRAVAGLIITSVERDSPADRGGLEPGMVLTDAGGKLVGHLDDIRRVVADRPAGRDLVVRIRKQGKVEFRVIVAPDPAGGPMEPPLDPLPSVPSRPL